MKIISFHGGLGNQIFEYIYLQYLRKKYPTESFYSFFCKKRLSLHNGFELKKWFDVDIPKTSKVTNITSWLCYQANRILRRMGMPLLFTSDDAHINYEALFHDGWFQDKKYFLEVGVPQFANDLMLDENNKSILRHLSSCNSVSVHIRRGDFLLPKNDKSLGGICTHEYYQKAMDMICHLVENPVFFFFSDDPDYIMATYTFVNKIIVSCNRNEHSFFDLYLMAHAQNMILANSTFSCIAAYINKQAKVVICPTIWNRRYNPNLSLDNWIEIE